MPTQTTNHTASDAKPARRFQFSALLVALVAMLIVAPFLGAERSKLGPGMATAVMTGFFILMLIAAVRAVSPSRRHVTWSIVLATPAALLELYQIVDHSDSVMLASYAVETLFIGFVIVMIVVRLFREHAVTADLICASVCAYLLMGVLWAIWYSAAEVITAHSFNLPYQAADGRSIVRFGGPSSFVAIYYSMVTMTTLGYGDIIPLSPVARSLAYLQAVVGQLYLTILVARLVGLHIANSVGQTSDTP